MLCVDTKIKKSKIAGLGLFADEDIARGALIWRYDPKIDLLFSKEDVFKLSPSAQKQFYNYAFFDKFHKKYMLCGDDGRFFNHSDYPNCDDGMKDTTIALRDIKKGEELTVDYKAFYGDPENHPEIDWQMTSALT